MHKYARAEVGRDADCWIQPYWFGDHESKRTGLWLKGLPPLMPTQAGDQSGRSVFLDRWSHGAARPSPRWNDGDSHPQMRQVRSRTILG